MDDNITKILDGLPPRPPRSRLDPHSELIKEMRRRGRTYKEIARVLAETCQVKSSPSNIYYFVRLRARVAKRLRQAKAQQAKQIIDGRPAVSSNVAFTQTRARGTAPRGNPPEDIAQRIAAVRNRKPAEPSPTGFTFDPNEPLRLIDPGKQKPED
jgi:IS30 family transposase